MLVVGIAGSLRRGSYNRMLLQAAGRRVPPSFTFQVLDGVEDVPPYDAELDTGAPPPAVRRLRDTIAVADAVVIATPEYNASAPGWLKNALDWASRPFPDNCLRRKPVAVVGASTGVFGAVWAQAELRRVLTAIGADVVDAQLNVPTAHEAFTAGGAIRDPALDAGLQAVVDELLGRVAERAA